MNGPAWFYDPDGLFHVILEPFGVHNPPSGLANRFFLGVSYWDWLAGPSVAMCVFVIMAVFTTSGTFMLLFLAALQNIDDSINEAAELDGASEWRKFRHITVPDDPADDLHGRDARSDRHLADLRPDLRRDEGQPARTRP